MAQRGSKGVTHPEDPKKIVYRINKEALPERFGGASFYVHENANYARYGFSRSSSIWQPRASARR